MDLDDFRPSDEPVGFTLINPRDGTEMTVDEKPVRWLMVSPDDKRMVDFEHDVQRRRLKASQNTGRLEITIEQVEAEAFERLATATAGFENIRQGGVEVVFSKAEAKRLLKELGWLREQVSQFYSSRGNFIAPSAKS